VEQFLRGYGLSLGWKPYPALLCDDQNADKPHGGVGEQTRPAFPVRKVLAAATGVLLVMGVLVIFHGNVAPLTVRTTLSTNTYWSENTPAPTHAPVNSNTATSRMGAAFSGGGWRAQAASIGFAKALKDTGVMDTMDACRW